MRREANNELSGSRLARIKQVVYLYLLTEEDAIADSEPVNNQRSAVSSPR